MIVVVCIDNKYGMMFYNRRQSQDREVRADVLRLTGGKPLHMSPYSAKQFAKDEGNYVVSDHFLEEAGNGDYCFVEDANITPFADKIEKLILYYWGRKYPADQYFPLDMTHWKLVDTVEFPGYSHQKILREICIPKEEE